MKLSLIEVEAMSKKAARGAGYSWGVAEEAAKAVGWLCRNGIDGVNALAVLLEQYDGAGAKLVGPNSLDGDWNSADGSAFCPLTVGASLSDCATLWGESGKDIANVCVPVLVVPFVAYSARAVGNAMEVNFDDCSVVTDGQSIWCSQFDDCLRVHMAENMSVRPAAISGKPLPVQIRAVPTKENWAVLERFAHRTYAPDTEESRQKGAGAGLSDND